MHITAWTQIASNGEDALTAAAKRVGKSRPGSLEWPERWDILTLERERMKHLGITFPTSAEAAVRDAAEDRGLSAGERFHRLLSLIQTVEGIFGDRPDRERQLALRNRRKDEEIEAIVRAQIRGHV